MDRLNKLIKKIRMEIIEFLKSLWGISGGILAFTILVVILGAYVSYKDGKTSDRIDKGVADIDKIVTDSKKELDKANIELQKNIGLATANLKSTDVANKQLLETNEKLNQASLQLERNYKKTVDALKESIEAKEEALNAKNETIKSKDEVIGQFTGGNTYPKIELKKGGFYLTSLGGYTIPELNVRIFIIPNYLDIPKQVTIDYLKGNKIDTKYIIPVFNKTYPKFWAGHSAEIIDIANFNEYLLTNNNATHAFEIYFESKFKKWKQKIRIISHNGKWEVADILDEIPTTQKDNVRIFEKNIYSLISENFPAQQTNSHTGIIKIIPLFNTTPYHPFSIYYDMIDYSPAHGVSDYSLDEL